MSAPTTTPMSMPPWLVPTLAVLATALLAQTAVVWLAAAVMLTVLGGASRRRLGWWPAVSVVLVLSAVNSMKWPESDLREYYQYFEHARESSLLSLLAEEDSFLSIRVTEPLFRGYMWLLAHLTPAPRIAFSLLSSMAIYGMALALCARMTNGIAAPNGGSVSRHFVTAASVASATALLAGITFSLTGHLVRQYLAGGVFALGVFGYAFTGRWRWLLLPAVAGAIHNSVLILGAPLLLVLCLGRRPGILAAALLAWLVLAFAGQVTFVNELAEAISFLKEDGEIGIALPALDASVLVSTWLLWRKSPPTARPSVQTMRLLLWFGLALAVLLFSIRDVPLLFFRSYFYVEFLRTPMLAFIVGELLRRTGRSKPAAAAVAFALAAALCWVRVLATDWSYSSSSAVGPDFLWLPSAIERWRSIETLRL